MATAVKKKAAKKATPAAGGGKIDNVVIRMYCLGTGDCFILKYRSGTKERFTMMIDCGTCQGTAAEVRPYLENLAAYVGNKVDLLVVTHEHNDHVNGFAKCEDIFKQFSIGEAWFAWTEEPGDPGGMAAELQKKRSKMKMALHNSLVEMKKRHAALEKSDNTNFYKPALVESGKAFLNGLQTLADINLAADGGDGDGGNPLPGMVKIKALLKSKKVKTKYLHPGDTVTANGLPGVQFHVLGPPTDRDFVFKDGKEGTDVYKRNKALTDSALAANAFLNLAANNGGTTNDLPFAKEYIVPFVKGAPADGQDTTAAVVDSYRDKGNSWRTIEDDWLSSAGSLALRLNSHINNTSLALALEFDGTDNIVLFPGDAEYGSWESWHLIEKWKTRGKNNKPFAEELLNRALFYKVGHHLSYNGTALEKGIMMMNNPKLVSMATLDRSRISKGWKTTMPNKELMKELIRRCQGKVFIMNEFDIADGPSKTLDPASLGKAYVSENLKGKKDRMYIQYTLNL